MNRLVPALAAAMTLLPLAAGAACDLARFGEGVAGTCARSSPACVPGYLPEEIRAIGRGAALEWIGLSVNDGRATWRALDIDRGEVVVVERYAGRRVAQAPAAEASAPHDYARSTGTGSQRLVDHVRRYPVSDATMTALACHAADAAAPAAAGAPPGRMLTDMSSRFYLLLGEQARGTSTLGRFEGPVAAFERGIEDVAKRQKPGVKPN